jgi:hypothetical protein
LRTGFTSPPRLTLKSLLSFAMHQGGRIPGAPCEHRDRP